MKTKNLSATGILLYPVSLILLTVISVIGPVTTIAAPGTDLRPLASFKSIDLSGPYHVILIQGDQEQVLVEADDAVIANVITKVVNGTLEVYNKEKMKSQNPVKITITFKSITGIDCSGAIVLKAETPMKLTRLDLDLSGACTSDLDLTADELSIDISGAAVAKFKGSVRKVDLDISGTGSLSASALETDEYEIEISGTGNAKVNARSKMDVSVSGAGSVLYSGDPKITREVSGAGSVSKM